MASRLGRETTNFARQLFAEIVEHAEIEGQEAFLAEAFTDLVLGELEEEGLWPDYQLAFHKQRGAEVAAWGLDDVSRVLYLAVTDFVGTSEAETLPRSRAEQVLRRLMSFLQRAQAESIETPEHSPAVDVIQAITEGTNFDAVELFLLSNRIIADAISIEDPDFQIRVWDLESIRRFRESGTAAQPIHIDFESEFGAGIPCLLSPKGYEDVDVLLAFVPGAQLARIYEEYGPRLLERNVRSFLMARGAINRGIRDTLRDEPSHFLAYNNGITATASEVRVEHGDTGSFLLSVKDLQIVNGGQTTASISVAGRDSDVNLDDVSVQMKLAVVAPEVLDTLVPNISRFANRQNAVQESDLSANHDHLRLLQSVSRTEWTPSHGTGRPTKWYFERARGSYAVEKTQAGTPADQRRFVSHYPPRQKFGKNELALFELTWSRKPHLVCRGGQKSFAEYMGALSDFPDASEDELREIYRGIFRDLVAKAILFRSADRLVRTHLGGTYKRQVVAYTLAYLLESDIGVLSLKRIWDEQQVIDGVERALVAIAEPLKDHLIASGRGYNITEWAKQEACWTSMTRQEFRFEPVVDRPDGENEARPNVTADGTLVSRSAPQGDPGLTLADAIEEVFGERIDGNWSRYRRRKWNHLGDTGVMAASGRSTYHVFAADFVAKEGAPYTLHVVVDFPGRSITPVEQLPVALRTAILERLRSPSAGGRS